MNPISRRQMLATLAPRWLLAGAATLRQDGRPLIVEALAPAGGTVELQVALTLSPK